MKIEYIRNIQVGYMRVTLSKPLSKTEEEMLTRNTIEGLLPVRWQKENDKYLLRYDITGKQALDGVLENTLVDERLLKSLLVGIYVAVKQLEKYLLPQEGLLLSPESIFWDYKTETMHFCYCPEREELLQERIVKLMEYVLAKTDHKNISVVQLAYGVYEEVQKPTFCMEDLPGYLQLQNSPAIEQRSEEIIREEKSEMEEAHLVLKQNYVQREFEKWINKMRWKDKIMAWIRDKIYKMARKEKMAEAVVFDETERVEEESATIILGVPQNEVEGVLRYEGVNSLPDIYISKVPFTVGSADNCDGIIKHPNISRYHAKITYQDETYFIEDLNSTNGTRVNGGMLSYKTRVSLKKNESLYLANEPYRFL